jgi:aryl-alcohol dehydrogenase-like predicted oxidoreductase
MSSFAFGTQRISEENLQHIEALKEAIESGVRLIDTAPYYTNGSAQKAVAKVMAYFEDDIRENLEIVSKYDFSDPKNLQRDLVETLQNLKLNRIETFLIDISESSLKRSHDDLLKGIYKAFVELEKEVQEQRIGGYGITSDGFAKTPEDPFFLPYEDLKLLAQKAAKEAGSKKDHFTTVEFPFNLLEKDGLACAKWAKKHNIRVLTNRALNAQENGLFYRLADYEEPKEYYHMLNELLEICENDQLQALYNLVEQMDINKHKFGFIGEYDNFLMAQILPHIKKTIQNIAPEVLDTLLEYIDRFLRLYRDMVAYESSKMTRVALKEHLKDCTILMQECALEFVMNQEYIDYIIVGMRKPTYVQEVVSLKR